MAKKDRPKMYRLEPFEVKGIATEAFLLCCSCGKTISAMGGCRKDIICAKCAGKEPKMKDGKAQSCANCDRGEICNYWLLQTKKKRFNK